MTTRVSRMLCPQNTSVRVSLAVQSSPTLTWGQSHVFQSLKSQSSWRKTRYVVTQASWWSQHDPISCLVQALNCSWFPANKDGPDVMRPMSPQKGVDHSCCPSSKDLRGTQTLVTGSRRKQRIVAWSIIFAVFVLAMLAAGGALWS